MFVEAETLDQLQETVSWFRRVWILVDRPDLERTATLSDVTLVDELPSGVDFDRWVEQPPEASLEDDAVTWQGAVGRCGTVDLAFFVTYVQGTGKVVTNTVELSHAPASEAAMPCFGLESTSIYPWSCVARSPSVVILNKIPLFLDGSWDQEGW